MREILEELGTLGGVHHGCIVKDGQVVSTTFPALLNDNLGLIARITDRIFKGAGSIDRTYNEIYFELDENYLLGFPLQEGAMVLLLTGKDVNFALIHMTVQSAGDQIAKALATASSEPVKQETSESVPGASAHPAQNRPGSKIDPSMKPVLNEVLEALTLQIGPVSRIVMGEALKKWRSTFEPVEKNVPALINMLAKEIDDELARQEFLSTLKDLMRPSQA